MAPLSINISAPKAANYMPISQYENDDNALCPRFADADSSSAPPSPASIESFDVLDSVPWRQGYMLDSSEGKGRFYETWAKRKSQVIAGLLLVLLLVAGCAIGGFAAMRYERGKVEEVCYARGGGERCAESAWAKCVKVNGLGYCEGIMG